MRGTSRTLTLVKPDTAYFSERESHEEVSGIGLGDSRAES